VERDLGMIGHGVAVALLVDAQPVDFLEQAGAVGKERLARGLARGKGAGAVVVPGGAVRLQAHVGEGIEPILRGQRHAVDRARVGLGPGVGKAALRVEISVGWGVEVIGVRFHRVRRMHVDEDLHRRGQALPPQRVVARRAARVVRDKGQARPRPRLVRGDKRRCVGDRRVRPRDMGDPHLRGHARPLLSSVVVMVGAGPRDRRSRPAACRGRAPRARGLWQDGDGADQRGHRPGRRRRAETARRPASGQPRWHRWPCQLSIRFSRSVRPVYSVRNRPRRCNSGTRKSTTFSRSRGTPVGCAIMKPPRSPVATKTSSR